MSKSNKSYNDTYSSKIPDKLKEGSHSQVNKDLIEKNNYQEVFYKGGQIMPGGERAAKGGELIKVPIEKAREIEGRRNEREPKKTAEESGLVKVWYEGGKKMPGGGIAKEEGEFAYVTKEKALEIEARRGTKKENQANLSNKDLQSKTSPNDKTSSYTKIQEFSTQTSKDHDLDKTRHTEKEAKSKSMSGKTNDELHLKKFYEGGQFLPGGGRAPKGGIHYSPPVYDPADDSFLTKNIKVYDNVSSSSNTKNSDSIQTKFYKGGQFMPNGGRAPKNGAFYKPGGKEEN